MNVKPNLKCKIQRTHPDAVLPTKAHPSDSCYDLYVVDVVKKINNVTFYTAGFIAEPPRGWEIHIYPRSSISKTGYLLANSVGVVDQNYRGDFIVALYKYDDTAADLALPCKIAQMRFVEVAPHVEIEEAAINLDTDRGSGGFGSTGN